MAWDSMTSDEQVNPMGYQSIQRDEENFVRIYQIHVKNSIDGGASSCIPCQDAILLGQNRDVCTACGLNSSSQPGPYELYKTILIIEKLMSESD